jgi:diaminobutyrate-2-oxoglutarate transaminase
MRRLETPRRLKSSARTYASQFEAVFESGTGVRMRFITSDHVRQVLELTTPARFKFVQAFLGLLPTPAKLHLTFPDTRACWKISPSPD